MHHLIYQLIIALLFFLFYLLVYSAFEEVGFEKWEAMLIVFSCVIFGWVDLPFFRYDGWIIAINVGGALLPVMISIYLMISRRISGRIVIGMVVVAYVTYHVTSVTAAGITSSFPYWLIPPLVASMYSLLVCARSRKKAASIAYASGTMGVLIGADILHLRELLSMHVSKTTVASIGGAAILDMVFLTGIIAVLIDALLYGKGD